MTIRSRTRTASSGLLPTAPDLTATPRRDVRLMPPARGLFAAPRQTAEHPLTSFVGALLPQGDTPRPPSTWTLAPAPVALATLLPRLAVAPPMTNLGATVAAPPTPAAPVGGVPSKKPTLATPPRITLLGY